MKTIEIKGWIFAQPKDEWMGGGFSYEFSQYDYEKWTENGTKGFEDRVKVGEYTIKTEVRDDIDPTAVMLRALESEKEQVRKDFNEKISQINDRIAKLQALTFDAA